MRRQLSADDEKAVADYFKPKKPSKYRNVKTVVDGVKRQQPERAEQRAIVQLLRSIGASVYVLGTTRRKGDDPGTMQTPGIPDLWAFIPAGSLSISTSVWIEVKAKNGKPSAAQWQFAQECQCIGINHIMGGLDDVMTWLHERGNLK